MNGNSVVGGFIVLVCGNWKTSRERDLRKEYMVSFLSVYCCFRPV